MQIKNEEYNNGGELWKAIMSRAKARDLRGDSGGKCILNKDYVNELYYNALKKAKEDKEDVKKYIDDYMSNLSKWKKFIFFLFPVSKMEELRLLHKKCDILLDDYLSSSDIFNATKILGFEIVKN